MNTQHTPGPWHVIPDPAWVGKHPLHDARFVATCDMSGVEYESGEIDDGSRPWSFERREDSIVCTMPDAENQKANARLIAAAPDLLAACQRAYEGLVCRAQPGCSIIPRGDCQCWSCQTAREINRAVAKATAQ